MRAKLTCPQTHDCSIDSDGVQHIWYLGFEVDKYSEVVLKRFLVLLLTREKIALGKLWTLETLKIQEDPLFQIFPSMYHSRD
jgi:hypothetical protein